MTKNLVEIGFVSAECFDDGADLYGDAPRPQRRGSGYGSYALLDGTAALADGEELLDAEAAMLALAEERKSEHDEMIELEEMLRDVVIALEDGDVRPEVEIERHLEDLDLNALPPAEFERVVAWLRAVLDDIENGASRTSSRRAVYEKFGGFELRYFQPPAHQPFKERARGRARHARRTAA